MALKKAGLELIALKQYQRYPISNHFYWLCKDKPGGHQYWSFLDDVLLNTHYGNALARVGKCDTLIAYAKQRK